MVGTGTKGTYVSDLAEEVKSWRVRNIEEYRGGSQRVEWPEGQRGSRPSVRW